MDKFGRYCQFSTIYQTSGYRAYYIARISYYNKICFVNWEKLPGDGPGIFNKINHIIFDEQVIVDNRDYSVYFRENYGRK